MSKTKHTFVKLHRVEKDKNGRPIPIYRKNVIEKSPLTRAIEEGKKIINKVRL